MKIIPSQNRQNFGYNLKLNDRLNKRLEIEPDSLIKQLIKTTQDQCIFQEETIKSLEGSTMQDIDDNETLINLILDSFIPLKTYLCGLVDRFFPELSYSKIEADTYENEQGAILNRGENSWREDQRAFNWRADIETELIHHIDRTNIINTNGIERVNSSNVDLKAKKGGTSKENIAKEYISSPKDPTGLWDVVGLQNTIQDIEDLIIFPIEYPDEAQQRLEDYGIEIPSFVIFYGAPGCGKTMLAKAIANQTNCKMYSISLAEVGSSYVNETAKNIAQSIEAISKSAVESEKPIILFLDEMDALLAKRDYSQGGTSEDVKVVDTLLPILEQAANNNVIIIGATNRYDAIDSAVKRRCDFNCYIGLPNEDEIVDLLEKTLSCYNKSRKLAQNKDELRIIAKELKGHSPSNIVKILKSHALKNASRSQKELEMKDVLNAIKQANYEKINEKEYKSEDEKAKIGFSV